MSRRPLAIAFGTSGWRGVLGESFTAEAARAVVRAIGEALSRQAPAPRVLVAHDSRAGGPELAAQAAGVLSGLGARVLLAPGVTPTPAASYAVRRRRLAAGLVFTASHNPPAYQGLKWIDPSGGAAPAARTGPVERRASQLLARGADAEVSAGPSRSVEARVRPAYLRSLLSAVDGERLATAAPRVFYDAMHGAGAGWLDAALREAGVRVRTLRGRLDPRFGGVPPDPSSARLHTLRSTVRGARGRRLGLASDGDADRYAVVDADGRLLAEADALALLIDHLLRARRVRRGLALSWVTGSLPEKVARAHGLPVERHPVGFKHLTRVLVEGRADVAGEESGGFALAPRAVDKDGMLASLLLVELAAAERRPLRARLDELRRLHGPGRAGRAARPATPAARATLRRLGRRPPRAFDGCRVVEVERRDGLRLALEDGGFVAWRASGTEPLLRVYAEAPGPRLLTRRLRAGLAALGR